jgi:hypothetical protein
MTALQTPADDAPAAEWGRLAVSIPGWRWMAGMRVLHIEGGDVGPVRGTYLSPWSLGQDGDLLIQWDDYAPRGLGCSWATPQVFRPHPWVFDYVIPDPDHPATAGCLWVLAGRPTVTRSIAAAAALGRWPGGDS